MKETAQFHEIFPYVQHEDIDSTEDFTCSNEVISITHSCIVFTLHNSEEKHHTAFSLNSALTRKLVRFIKTCLYVTCSNVHR